MTLLRALESWIDKSVEDKYRLVPAVNKAAQSVDWRVNYPYCLIHDATCQHLFIVTDVR